MSISGGYCGKILMVSLTDGSTQVRDLSEPDARLLIGGDGINSKLLYQMIPAGIDPFRPENVVALGAGPFVGTLIPSGSKTRLGTLSPISGGIATSGSGQMASLKNAGFDHLVITGRAENPVYLVVTDESVELKDARDLWGKDLWEATDAIWQELDRGYQVAAIGPAGENLCREAAVIANRYAAFGRNGVGAVFGSKNLKAIAIKGSRGIKVKDRKRFLDLVDQLSKEVRSHPNFDTWRELGTLMSLENFLQHGNFPYHNQRQTPPERFAGIYAAENFRSRFKLGDVACQACVVGCKHFIRLKDGPYAGMGFPVSCLLVPSQFGTSLGLESWDDALKAFEIFARMGLDSISLYTILAYVFELYEKGILSSKETGGLDLTWGNADSVHQLIEMIGRRQGIGDILAEGLPRAARQLAPQTESWAMVIKGLGCVFDPRMRMSAEAFSQMTNTRGGGPSNTGVTAIPRPAEKVASFCDKIGVPPDKKPGVMQGPEGFHPGRLAKWCEDFSTLLDCLGICRFPIYQRVSIRLYADLYGSLTGLALTPEEMLKAGANLWHLHRAFNLKHGLGRNDDHLPGRFYEEPLRGADKEYPPLDRDQVEKWISDYYEERGWDRETGEVPVEIFSRLGL
ncbi:aldehyde ferredoxin oxidoreductase family protein [Thermodesulfobacteriota bacterium]